MKELKFENQGTNTYLVYEISNTDDLDTMSLGMLTNNDIPGFATASFMQMDLSKFIKYNVSAKVSVTQLFSGPVNKKRLLGVFTGIINAMLSAEDYMLDPNTILLDLDYIFADVSTCETVLICLPILNGDQKAVDLGVFFKNIIFSTQFDQTENCDHVAQILNYLNRTPVLNLPDFRELLEKIGKSNEPEKMVQPKPVANEPARIIPTAKASQQPVAPPVGSANTAGSQAQPVVRPKHENLQFGPNYSAAGKSVAPAKTDTKTPPAQEEKPMSMFYLLQHYSKENAAIYKAQQEAKKAKKSGAAPAVQPKVAPKQANAGFAVPGMKDTVAPAIAIPGQQQSVDQAQKTVQPAAKVEAQPVAPKQTPAPVYQQHDPLIRPVNFGETTVLGSGIGETTVLSAAVESNRVDPHLIRVKNNEKIPLNKPVFRIGKERSYVDYFISDNTAISRSHANIINHGGEFFVVDTNSTNHTYVNGGMIHSNVETKLSHGAKIRLANEDFEFRLY